MNRERITLNIILPLKNSLTFAEIFSVILRFYDYLLNYPKILWIKGTSLTVVRQRGVFQIKNTFLFIYMYLWILSSIRGCNSENKNRNWLRSLS